MHSKKILLAIGIAAGVLTPVLYYFLGFNLLILGLWLAGLVLAALGIRRQPEPFLKNFRKRDAVAIYILLLLFVPALLLYLYSVPYQVNTDEATIMIFQKLYQSDPNIFGSSIYFGFPSFTFILTGFLAKLFGGVSLLHSRMVHAGMGLVTVLLAYLYFRQYWKILPAFGAAIVLGFNHSFLALSRMAMRDNSALLVEVLSFPFLLFGLKKQNYFYTFIGGSLAGLSYYTYQPGRIIIFVWLGFLVTLAVVKWQTYSIKFLGKLAFVTLLGFFMVAAPVMVSEAKLDDPAGDRFERERFLFLPEGQKLQQEWVVADSIKQGVLTNISNGLGTFNNNVHDYGYIYPNFGHGFVDPISGVLLWIGVASLLVKLFKGKILNHELLALVAFIGLWLVFAFLVNKTPNYTRMLIILPFFAMLVVTGIIFICNAALRLFTKFKFMNPPFAAAQLATIALLMITALNIDIFAEFAYKGLNSGDSVGSTARHIEQKKNLPNHQFVLVADKDYPYYYWGESWQWLEWMTVFAQPSQKIGVVKPADIAGSLPREGSFTVFMNLYAWVESENYLRAVYPTLHKFDITKDGSLVGLEIAVPAPVVP